MKIDKMLSQYRRDFWANYICQSCGHIEKDKSGYDDDNFHQKVIPNMKCKKCGKSTNDLGIKNEPRQTKYESWEVV